MRTRIAKTEAEARAAWHAAKQAHMTLRVALFALRAAKMNTVTIGLVRSALKRTEGGIQHRLHVANRLRDEQINGKGGR
jgi:hypothetical protein